MLFFFFNQYKGKTFAKVLKVVTYTTDMAGRREMIPLCLDLLSQGFVLPCRGHYHTIEACVGKLKYFREEICCHHQHHHHYHLICPKHYIKPLSHSTLFKPFHMAIKWACISPLYNLNMHSRIIYNSQDTWQQSKCPSTDEDVVCVGMCVYTHTGLPMWSQW